MHEQDRFVVKFTSPIMSENSNDLSTRSLGSGRNLTNTLFRQLIAGRAVASVLISAQIASDIRSDKITCSIKEIDQFL